MALSKVPQLFVIARESTLCRYKGKGARISQVSEELGAQYVLEGSVQRAGDRGGSQRSSSMLPKGHHLWSERYDRSMKDLFDLQDEITMKILTELRVTILQVKASHISAKGTTNLPAYLKVLEADGYRNQNNKEANAVAIRLSQEAVELDPNYPTPHRILAIALLNDVRSVPAKHQKRRSPRP